MELLPDLVTLQPDDMTIVVEEGSRRLRFSNHIANLSAGVLELFPGDTEFALCGDAANPGRHVYQRIYTDTSGYGYFTRTGEPEVREELVGCMLFHPEHDHWHIDGFTSFELRNESGETIRGSKRSTCMMDSGRGFNLDGAPIDPYYLYKDCGRDTPQGISVGWVDTYEWELPEMFIDITGVPDGAYCLVSMADPGGNIIELDDSNNTAAVRVEIAGDTVTPRPDVPCPGETETRVGPPRDGPPPEIFKDTLHWKSWSWNTTLDTQATAQVYEGRWSMSVTYTEPWAGLSLDGLGFNTTGYSELRFLLHANRGTLPVIYVNITDVNGVEIGEAFMPRYAHRTRDGWYEVRIPLSVMNVTNTVIEQVRLEEGAGAYNFTYYLDDMAFIPQAQ